MGIKTVAVYSDADATALHVEMADEKVYLGPSPASESYLLGDKIVQACKDTGAEAVHPGYGFLSEREWFAQALADANIAFIGPPPKAIAAMGDKIESKKLAKIAGVHVVPGFVGEINDTNHAVEIANGIGYPVMMKASAGGGGKGMRLAYSEKEVRETFQQVRSEALSSFGDDRVFIEKFVEQPRHIEIQVLGDKHGTVLYLGERECSIQRRHQAVGYYSAGTVEFIAGADRSFYFLEMNTRLQVEHPVTEEITGLDLVEKMIRVAYGEKLGMTQSDVKLNGWAIETRLYAEDPYRNFLPSIGRLTSFLPPEEENGVRVDTGVVEGGEISMFYDPMIAKLVTYGKTRDEAIAKQIDALDRYRVRGIGHNVDFLSAVMQHPRFQSGNITTGFIAEEYPDGFAGAAVSDEMREKVIAAAAVINNIEVERNQLIDGQLNGHSANYDADWTVMLGRDGHDVAVENLGDSWEVTLGEKTLHVATHWRPGDVLCEAHIDGNTLAIQLDRTPIGYLMTTHGHAHNVRVMTRRAAQLAGHMLVKVPPDMSRYLLCPMPGLVIDIQAEVGQSVEPGQPLAIVEAMKMQNILRAEKSAVVKSINAKAGESLAVDAIIMEFE